MTYDNAGNMLTRKKYSYTTGTLGSVLSTQTLTYGNATWGDVLTAINGTAVTSDAIGNVLNDGTWTYTWKNGRQLATMSKSGVTWSFVYDASGMRTKRTDGTTAYTYIYDGTSLNQMKVGSNTLVFIYGSDGYPMAVRYNYLNFYYYVTNVQGDVIAIVDSAGNELVTYTYDAWGNVLSTGGTMATTLGKYNPFRYRGYVYDQETGLYYLQSRYYSPYLCRFINADTYVSTGQGILGYNMFAYCNNNPVIYVDPSGKSFSIILGFNFNLFGFGGTFSINLVSTEENFGIQYSYYISDDDEISSKNNLTVGVDFGPYIGIQYTEKENMRDLEGFAKSTGGDLLLGLDIITDESGDYFGWQFGTSAFSANMHSIYTNTETLLCISTINVVKILVDWLFGG